MREKGPAESPFDLIVAALVAGELAFCLASSAIIIYFQFHVAGSSGRLRRLLGLNSLWPVRLLLLLLAALLSVSELLRLPLLRRRLPSHLSPRLCTAYFFISPALAEPAFFSTLLFLLRAPTHNQNPAPRAAALPFLSAAAAALAASLPFLLLNSLFLFLPNSLLHRLGLPPYFLGHAAAAADAFSPRHSRFHRRNPCSVPLFSTVLLAALAAVYVPLFVSAIWNAVAVVINKRLRVRLYALSSTVIAALSVQVAARALAALWDPSSAVSQALNLTAFASLLFAIVSGEVILVLQPVVDSLVVVVADDKRLRTCGERADVGGGSDV
ncbi:hypothetical protein KSP39_PZI023056 [Platanthera zijinensis]|uniref:Uncharacterized protein n=1 Tax=Platanthera zijinensis TaxID=2320716 RepID=A0AAP0AW92_9ASPA